MTRHRAVMQGAEPVLLCGARWTGDTIATWQGRLVSCRRCAAASTVDYEPVKGGLPGMLRRTSRSPSGDAQGKGPR